MTSFTWGLAIGICTGAVFTYMVMDMLYARTSTWLSERLKACSIKAVERDTLHLLDTFSDRELIAAVKSGLDPLVEARRKQLSELHKELHSGPPDLPGAGKDANRL